MLVFDKIIPLIEESVRRSGSFVVLSSNERIPLSRDFFVPLSAVVDGRTVAFIDGGNSEFLSGPNVSVQLARIYVGFWKGNVRVRRVLREFIIVVRTVNFGESGFEARVFDVDGNEFVRPIVVDRFDSLLSSGGHPVVPSAVASHVRRLAELHLAMSVCDELSKGDIVVRDGDLSRSGVEVVLAELESRASSRGVFVVGLSKTSRLCTDVGGSALSALSQLSPGGSWLYDSGSVGFVKLHSRSKFIFRLDGFSSLRLVASVLAGNSADPSFLGYPYGLVDADKSARVPLWEAAQWRARFAVKSGGKFSDVEAAVNAHDWLSSL